MLNGGLSLEGYQTLQLTYPSLQRGGYAALPEYRKPAYAGQAATNHHSNFISVTLENRVPVVSIQVTSWALNEAPVENPLQVLILVALSERCKDDGSVAYPSVKTIASKTRVSVRTIHRELKNLEAMGVIQRGDQRHVDHLPPNRRPVVYDLNVSLRRGDNLTYQDSGVSQVTDQTSSGVTSVQVRGDNHDTSGVTRMADNSSLITSPLTNPKEIQDTTSPSPTEPDDFEWMKNLGKIDRDPDAPDWMLPTTAQTSRETLEQAGLNFTEVIKGYQDCGLWPGEKPNDQRFTSWVDIVLRRKANGEEPLVRSVKEPANFEEAFDMFWDAYPKKERRVLAYAAFKMAVTQTDPVNVIQMAKGYARTVQGKDPQYTAAPHTWLKDQRWTDKYPSVLPPRSRTAADY
jgi:hypothetical protein